MMDWMKPLEIHEGEVWFDPRVPGFFQIRGRHDDFVRISGLTEFYDDSKTNRHTSTMSFEYLSGCLRADPPDKLPNVEMTVYGWKAVS